MDPVRIAITFDADSDFYEKSISAGSFRSIEWQGVAEGIPRLLDILGGYSDSEGKPLRVTWCIRMDNQIETLCGHTCFLLDRFADLWREARLRGDEFAWHPHLYRQEGGRWLQEMDEDRLEALIRQLWPIVHQACPSICCTRIGEAYGSNRIMATMAKLGMHADSSAMPGRVRIDDERQLDWEPTPSLPYRPSRADYRLPGEPAWNILQVPFTMIRSQADYDSQPFSRYLDLAYHHRAIADGIRERVADAPLVVTITHPSTLLSGQCPAGHGLLSFDADNFRRNLDHLIACCEAAGRTWRFITLRECNSNDA